MVSNVKVSLQTIADSLNISKVTVSKALNDKEGVSEELREVIKLKAKELGYQVNLMAKGLKSNKTYNIGILIPERYIQSTNSYYLDIYTKFTKEFADYGYSAIMEILDVERENQLLLPNLILSNKVDGLIILGEASKDYLRLFTDVTIPILFFDFSDNDICVDSVITDNLYSGTEITKMLLSAGHKKIGFIGNIYSTSSIKERFLGYYRALLDAGIKLNMDYIISDRNEQGVLTDLILPENMPTAFVCNNDQVAYTLCMKLITMGYSIPTDISIATFDNSIYSQLSPVKLTTVDSNASVMVLKAVKAISKKITVPNKVYDRIFVKGTVIIRDSIRKVKE